MIPTRKGQQEKQASLEDIINGAKASAADAEPATPKRGVGKPRHPDADEWTRQTFVIRKDYLEKLRDLGYWDRQTTKVVLDRALYEFFKDKDIKPIP